MTTVFSTTSRHRAWLSATEYLLRAGCALNVILSIDTPGTDGTEGTQAVRRLDGLYASDGQYPIRTVADTIFPAWDYATRGLDGLYRMYPDEVYPLIRAQWGTYAHRILRRQTATGETINPLKVMIEKMQRERSHNRSLKSCYEVGLAEGQYDLPLYSPSDAKLGRGGPCLSHLSFKLFLDAVHLTAIYRSHDYRYKVPGNLLGLARLQACVAREVGVSLGTLVVHSTYAFIDQTKGLGDFRSLVSDLRQPEPRNDT